MFSVTQRVKSTKQPRGGYLPPKNMQLVALQSEYELAPIEEESVSASVVGMCVDYLTRFMLTNNKVEAFKISMVGASVAETFIPNSLSVAKTFLADINGLDDSSIKNACCLVTFDVWFRNTTVAMVSGTYKDLSINNATIDNIRNMVYRSLEFYKQYGPITQDGFTFEPNGYTNIISAGDGDFLTKDTLWDFKVSKNKPTSKHTLQIIIYYLMGKHSGNPIFNTINKIGLYNPRLNEVYLYEMDKLPKDIEDIICTEIIGYEV